MFILRPFKPWVSSGPPWTDWDITMQPVIPHTGAPKLAFYCCQSQAATRSLLSTATHLNPVHTARSAGTIQPRLSAVTNLEFLQNLAPAIYDDRGVRWRNLQYSEAVLSDTMFVRESWNFTTIWGCRVLISTCLIIQGEPNGNVCYYQMTLVICWM